MISRIDSVRIFRTATSGIAMVAAALVLPPVPSTAQVPVVQPLPPAGASRLNDALRRLARNSQDLNALIEAGTASLEIGDIDAAIGFFGRADELSPGNPRIKVGLAGAFVRSERPIEALRLFDEAERAGASTLALAADRGLAYDLVGDSASAQMQYRQALAQRRDPEILRWLALSQAIARDKPGFEATLLPLLQQKDFGAFRTRAFGLAILGQEEEAVAIAEAVMPRELSARVTPYLNYMPRLTRAQQAAAANLGIFPRAAQIGRDDPRIAQYAGARGMDQQLAPAGEPLGPRAQATVRPPAQAREDRRTRRRPDRSTSTAAADRAASMRPVRSASAPAVAAQAAVRSPAPTPAPAPAPAPTPAPAPILVAQASPAAPAAARSSAELPPVSRASAAAVEPGFDLSRVAAVDVAPSVAASAQAQAPVVVPAVATEPQPASVADAFAGFAIELPDPVPAANGAVDITKIKAPREAEPKSKPEPAKAAPPKPEPPKNPSRVWVQVATGKNRAALKFDWRRLSRKAPAVLDDNGPFVTPWGQANRLLAGPYPSAKAARDAVAALGKLEIDSFTFTSDAGQAIEPLK